LFTVEFGDLTELTEAGVVESFLDGFVVVLIAEAVHPKVDILADREVSRISHRNQDTSDISARTSSIIS
jgi:hypothetical protein